MQTVTNQHGPCVEFVTAHGRQQKVNRPQKLGDVTFSDTKLKRKSGRMKVREGQTKQLLSDLHTVQTTDDLEFFPIY